MTEQPSFDFRRADLFAMRHLRFGRLWFGCGLLLVAAVVASSLVNLGPVGRVLMHDKLVHLLAYAALMGWFAQLFRHDLTRLVLAIGFVALGVGIEYLQAMTPTRQFETLDMLANASGVLLAWALAYTRLGGLLPALERRLPASASA